MVEIATSILNANFEKLDDEITEVCNAGCDLIHIDVMDGVFVKNKTDGIYMMQSAVDSSSVPIDVHLMVENPMIHIDDYLKANCITFHVEATPYEETIKIINYLHDRDIKVGLAIKPDTEVEEVEKFIELIDKVLVMTVEPGYGGQELIPSTLNKVKAIREKYPEIDIQVDGGINTKTATIVKKAGANILVVGSAIFNSNNKKDVIQQCKF